MVLCVWQNLIPFDYSLILTYYYCTDPSRLTRISFPNHNEKCSGPLVHIQSGQSYLFLVVLVLIIVPVSVCSTAFDRIMTFEVARLMRRMDCCSRAAGMDQH